MSIERTFQSLLAAWAPLTALVGDRIAQDAVPETGATRPLVVFGTTHDFEYGLDGMTVLGDTCTIVAVCWAKGGNAAAAVADQLAACLAAAADANVPLLVQQRSTTYEPDLLLDGVQFTIVWMA